MLLDIMSLPVWECGLKYTGCEVAVMSHRVTPCMGVWIEIIFRIHHHTLQIVTPCMGVWIEIEICRFFGHVCGCHSLYGSVD